MASVQGDVLRVVAKMVEDGNDIQNVYHFRITSGDPPSESSLATGCAQFLDDAYDNIQPGMPDDTYFASVAVYNETQDVPVGEVAWPTQSNGAKTTARLPPQCSPLVLFTTNVLNSLGKKFMPGLTVTDCDDDGSLTSGVITSLAAFAADLLVGFDGGTWGLQAGNYRKAVEQFIPWISSQVRDLYATQRRRYFGSGS